MKIRYSACRADGVIALCDAGRFPAWDRPVQGGVAESATRAAGSARDRCEGGPGSARKSSRNVW